MNGEELMALCKRRGVFWPSAELYGGAQGLYDYGPVGVAIKKRLEEAWVQWFVGLSPDYHLIDPAEILPEAVVRASGHLANFADLEVLCGQCGTASRADHLLEEAGVASGEGLRPEEVRILLEERKVRCPRCGAEKLSVPTPFNLMFGLDFGATGRERAYLRPETAQGAYLAFPRMWEVARKQLPFGIGVIGKAYRNEIAPRQGLFRMRAFTQAELQIFFDPEEFLPEWEPMADLAIPVLRADERAAGSQEARPRTVRELVEKGGLPPFYAFHMAVLFRFARDVLGYPADRIRFLEKNEKERAFYNRIHMDLEVKLDSLGGFKEMGAVHYRGDYDLTRHGEGSGTDLSVTTSRGKHLVPHVLEVTFGVDRNLWALADLHLATEPSPDPGEPPRTVWRLPSYLAPTLVGVIPLIRKEHTSFARELSGKLRDEGLSTALELTGSVGKRYARLDEIGVPRALTIDAETITQGTVTIRDRDTRAQVRRPVIEVAAALRPGSIPPRFSAGAGEPTPGTRSISI